MSGLQHGSLDDTRRRPDGGLRLSHVGDAGYLSDRPDLTDARQCAPLRSPGQTRGTERPRWYSAGWALAGVRASLAPLSLGWLSVSTCSSCTQKRQYESPCLTMGSSIS